jgi:glucose-1-phosphate thymidylyltransferase
MKGIVLAGGTGSRLWPITKGVSKQLLPVYDKPLIHYPLGTFFLAGIRDILIITAPEDLAAFQRLLGDGSQYGVSFVYETQEKPNGLAEAFIIGEKFIAGGSISLILGDNIFHGVGLGRQLEEIKTNEGATIFAYKVADPERYGVVSFDDRGTVKTLTEKPKNPESNYAVPGLYFYDNQILPIAKSLDFSDRLELEITDVNKRYMEKGQLVVTVLDKGTAWLDTGTVESLMDASLFIQISESRQGIKIGCIEEIAYKNEWIDLDQLRESAKRYEKTGYGKYLNELINETKK